MDCMNYTGCINSADCMDCMGYIDCSDCIEFMDCMNLLELAGLHPWTVLTYWTAWTV